MKCDATKAMEEARAGLITKRPSLGYLCFKLRWFPDSTSPTAWTDGVSVGFNPEFVLSLSKAERQFLAAHEVGHPMLGHHLRREGRNPKKWNIACDHVVNLILATQGFKLIKDCVMDVQFRGMAVEQVYNILFPPGQENDDQDQDSTKGSQNGDSSPDNEKQAPGDGSEQKDSSDEENGGDKDDSGSNETGEGDSDQAGGSAGEDGEQPGQTTPTGSDDGGASGPGEQPEKEGGDASQQPGRGPAGDLQPDRGTEDFGPGEVRDFPGETTEDFEMEAEKWDLAVQQAAQMERRLSPEGHVPGFIETMITNISDPKLPWTEILSRWLTSKAKNDYSWTKPNPRYSSTGFFMPSLESFDLGKVALFWDTSCSVTDSQVADIGSESQGILSHFPGVLIDLYHIDTKVQFIEEINQYTDWEQITARGRGGTDFRPGFAAIEEGEEDYPIGVIYMTDGECSRFPEEAPPYPVLWIILDMPQNYRFEPPFGEVAYYNDF